MAMLFKQKKQQEETKNDNNIKKIAVIDTETNWNDEVMSIGVVVASTVDFSIIDRKYYIITPEYTLGGMFSYTLDLKANKKNIVRRDEAIEKIILWLRTHNVKKIFAYNAKFDFRHLPEFKCFYWYDIMIVAANKSFNKKIPDNMECFKNGKLKRGYGVEPMFRLLSGKRRYCETHNGLSDAEDELSILAMLKLDLSIFEDFSIINKPE